MAIEVSFASLDDGVLRVRLRSSVRAPDVQGDFVAHGSCGRGDLHAGRLEPTFWFARVGLCPDAMALGRKGIYKLASGHATICFSTIHSRVSMTQRGTPGLLVMEVAIVHGQVKPWKILVAAALSIPRHSPSSLGAVR